MRKPLTPRRLIAGLLKMKDLDARLYVCDVNTDKTFELTDIVIDQKLNPDFVMVLARKTR